MIPQDRNTRPTTCRSQTRANDPEAPLATPERPMTLLDLLPHMLSSSNSEQQSRVMLPPANNDMFSPVYREHLLAVIDSALAIADEELEEEEARLVGTISSSSAPSVAPQ